MKIERREYQELLFRKILESEGHNLIIELDTGLGKRIISMMLAKEARKRKKRIVILLNSTASLIDTSRSFRDAKIDHVTLSSSTPSKLRKWLIEKGRVILSTPMTLLNTIEKTGVVLNPWITIINEVDKMVLRASRGTTVLVAPWPKLLEKLGNSWIVGLSGTIRDKHVLIDGTPRLFPEIETLRDILNADVIPMDAIMNTDVKKYILFAKIYRLGLSNKPLQALLLILSDMIRRVVARAAVRKPPENEEELIPFLIKTEAQKEFVSLALLRKYAVAMPKNKFLHFAHKLHVASLIGDDIISLGKEMVNPKFDAVVRIAKKRKKVVVLSSFIFTAKELEKRLLSAGIPVKTLTSRIYNKLDTLKWFYSINSGVLAMTPVGERDLDLRTGETLIVFDTINTVKTMYQRIRRIREGEVVFLYIKNSFEEKKVERVIREIGKRYPWSVKIMKNEFSIYR